jgi:hypothetical protein
MIVEALLIGGIATIGLSVADQQNMFNNNVERKWWWERVAWPWVAQTPAVGARINRAVQVQPQLSGEQQLQQARLNVIYSDQMLNYVSKKFPSLAVSSKYTVGQPSQPQQYTLPYQPKTYP